MLLFDIYDLAVAVSVAVSTTVNVTRDTNAIWMPMKNQETNCWIAVDTMTLTTLTLMTMVITQTNNPARATVQALVLLDGGEKGGDGGDGGCGGLFWLL